MKMKRKTKHLVLILIIVFSLFATSIPVSAFSETNNPREGFLQYIGFLFAILFIIIYGLFVGVVALFEALLTGSGNVAMILEELIQDFISMFTH